MDERTAMNVEFLRARLLSERIVSRTARQRSEMLSQRVMELEEQLRIVNIQRKQAEKAAGEVLSILEAQGITCVGELTDSSTELEDNKHTDQEGNEYILSKDIKEDEFHTPSRLDRGRVYDGSSLSWKSHGSSLETQQKQKTKMDRHRQNSNLVITMKSSKSLSGKSCRKIKRHDAGAASENELEKSPLVDSHASGVAPHPDDFDESHECLLEASENKLEMISVDPSVCSDSKDVLGHGDGMEKALEHQAQLIVRFQAMENAQRDWEAKFNETKMSMLENPEPGIQVKMAENSIWSADNSEHVGSIPRREEEETSSAKDISFTEDKKKNERCRNCEIADQRAASEAAAISVIETVPASSPNLARKAHPGPNFQTPNAGLAGNKKVQSPEGLHRRSSKQQSAPDYQKKLSIKEAKHAVRAFAIPSHENPGSRELIPVTHEKKISNSELLPRQQSAANSSSLESVLRSLRRAKISLGQELVNKPGNSPTKALDFPISSSVLFRLPSDSSSQLQVFGHSVYGSGLRLTATRPDLGLMSSAASVSPYRHPAADASGHVERYPYNPYMDDTRARVHKEYANFYPTRFAETESQVSAVKEYFDGHLSPSISASSASEHPPRYPDLSEKSLSLRNGIPNYLPDLGRNTMPFGDNRRSYGGNNTYLSSH